MSTKTFWAKWLVDDSQYKSGLNRMGKQTKSFGLDINKLGGMIAGAFAIERLGRFGAELVELGGKAQGVRAAFEHIAKPGLLNELRTATRGAVDDLTLMQNAVKASNFQIPLQSLAKLLSFASARAIQTGESVDYLVNSIILGIGRKSPLILDNLGISAVRLREELKGAGVEMNTVGDIAAAVGRIAESEMEKMGNVANTAQTETQKLATEWQNFKIFLGESLTPAVSVFLSELNNVIGTMKQLNSAENISFWDKLLLTISGGNVEVASSIAARVVEQEKMNRLEQEAIEMRDKILGIDKEQITVTKQLSEAQQEILDKQTKINEKVADDIANQYNKWTIIELINKSLEEQTQKELDLAQARAKVFDHEEETDDRFAYLTGNDLEDALTSKQKKAEELGQTLSGLSSEFGDFSASLVEGFDLASNGLEGFLGNMAKTVLKLISILLSNALANAITGATQSGTATGPAAVFTTPVFIGTAVAGVLSAFASIPKFAQGGIVPGGSFYGDAIDIRANSGEMILNRNQQRNLFEMINSGGNMNVTGQFVAKGGDLIAVIDRTNKVRNITG